MAQKPRASRKLALTNAFGSLGYLSVLFQWVWRVIIVFYSVFFLDQPSWLMPVAVPENQQSPTMNVDVDPQIGIAIAVVVTLIMIGATLYAIYLLPNTVGKKSAELTHRTAELVVPAITQHKKTTAKQRNWLTFRVVTVAKLLLILLPLAII